MAAELIASQIPFLVERRDGSLLLQGHLARPNPQVADLDRGGEALAIFPGPHAYISPSWYEAGPAVPTWNYASVHAYGSGARDRRPGLAARHAAPAVGAARGARARAVADATICRRPMSNRCCSGIVGVEIAVSRLEGKFKLSQNRPAADRPRIIAALERRDDRDSRERRRADARARAGRGVKTPMRRSRAGIPMFRVTRFAPIPVGVLLLACCLRLAAATAASRRGRSKILVFGDSLAAGFGLPPEASFPGPAGGAAARPTAFAPASSMPACRATPRPAAWRGSTGRWPTSPTW